MLTAILAVGSISVLPAKAGETTAIIGRESYTETLDTNYWYNADSDILAEGSQIVFPDDSTEATKLITQIDVERIEQLDTMVKARFDLQFTKLPEGETFAFGMGLSSLECGIEDEGNLILSFVNQGGLKAKLSAYEVAEEETVLMDAVSCGSLNRTVKVAVVITAAGKVELSLNGKTVYSKEIPVTGEGNVGFLQTGSCGAKLSNTEITMYRYERPENSDISEDFEKGEFNRNLFASKIKQGSSYSPCLLAVQEYNDNQVLMFQNVSKGYIVTKQQYSNFEMTFDLPYIQRESIAEEDGTVLIPRSESFGVSFGGDVGGNDDNVDFTGAADLLLFMGSGVMGWNTKQPMTLAKTHLYGDAGCTKTPTIKVSVIDTLVTVSVKWADEDDSAYEKMLSYRLSTTPTGYIGIWAPSEAPSSFAIDNIRIKNMDKDPKLVEVEYKGSKIEAPADYDYQPMEQKYKDNAETSERGMWYLPLLIVAGACVVAVGVTAGVTKAKTRKGKGGAGDEK